MYDLIIRNGIIYDGKGGSPFEADIAIEGTKIKKLGKIKEKGKEEIQEMMQENINLRELYQHICVIQKDYR